MDVLFVQEAVGKIYEKMLENKEYLIRLDQQNGDGDLGLSMCSGFRALKEFVESAQEQDLGKLLMQSSKVFNETAPSSLGTILSFGMMGMAKFLKGKKEINQNEMTKALRQGICQIMSGANSKQGEKTILDALIPAVDALEAHENELLTEALKAAAQAAAAGSESTRQMKSVHGRAAYYAEQSIGLLDGGSVVGKLIFEGLAQCVGERNA